MEAECVIINGVPTKVLTWGKRLKDCKSGSLPSENLNYIICIPGNPGVTEFYIEFLEELHKKTKHNVWIIGHAGHEDVEPYIIPTPKENKDLYDLQAQVKHKVSFIKDFVPSNAKLTLIGHSIGCYMILKLLKISSIRSRIVKSYLLFPTIEYMAETKNGVKLRSFIKYFSSLLFPLIMIFNIFPVIIQNFLIYIHCKISSIPCDFKDIIRKFIKPDQVYNSITLANEEMIEVRERDNYALTISADIVKLYYGADDGWVPLTYYENIKTDIPNIDAEVCSKGLEHAFVLKGSKLMADVIATWMKV